MIDSLLSQVKVETLYYFYSAIFQGFAAMFTLILMFVIYYFEKSDRRRYYYEQELEKTAKSMFSFNYINDEINKGKGLYEFIKEIINKRDIEQDKKLHVLIDACDKLNYQETFVKRQLVYILSLSFVILLSSIILLYLIDIINKNYYLSFYFALGIIVIMFVYFTLAGRIMYVIIGYKFVEKAVKWFLEH